MHTNIKRIKMLILFCVIGLTIQAQNFFTQVSPPDSGDTVTAVWKWRPTVTIPSLKIVESIRINAEVDALLVASTGGGISWQHLKFDNKEDKWKSDFSWSPLTILISRDSEADNPIDVSYATSFGFFQNVFVIGFGVELGQVTDDRSRWFGLISANINFNN